MSTETACYLIEYYRSVGQEADIPSIRLYDDINDIQSAKIGPYNVPVFNTMADVIAEIYEFLVAVGDPKMKRILVSKAVQRGITPAPTLIHPCASVFDANIGVGGVICHGCHLTLNITIGDFVILNTKTTVSHGSSIGSYSTTSAGVHISGDVTIGEDVTLYAGSVIREKKSIANHVIVGAQSMVLDNIEERNITVVGVPARKIR